MQTQACQPCAKRKVRCDRKEPCSNCQRRKQDHCVYADLSPIERIKQLEALVRNLEGGSEASIKAGSATSRPEPNEKHANGNPRFQDGTSPIIVRENGESNYLESCVISILVFYSLTDGEDLRGMAGRARLTTLLRPYTPVTVIRYCQALAPGHSKASSVEIRT